MKHYNIGSEFEIKDSHLKLLKESHVFFDELAYDGAAAVDGKRPYGNSGDVAYEVYRVLNDKEWNRDDEMPEDLHEELYQLHEETATALQICLVMQEFKTGVFRKTFYGSLSWEKTNG